MEGKNVTFLQPACLLVSALIVARNKKNNFVFFILSLPFSPRTFFIPHHIQKGGECPRSLWRSRRRALMDSRKVGGCPSV